MEYKTALEELKNEIAVLDVDEKIKSPLVKIENMLSHLYTDILDQEEDKIRLKINEYIEIRRKNLPINIQPLNLEDAATLVIHLIPMNSFKFDTSKPDIKLDLKNYRQYDLQPLYCTGWNPNTNENGLYSYSSQYGYTEIDTSGIVEAVDQGMLSYNPIPSGMFEKNIIEGLEKIQRILQQTEVGGKFILSISLLRIKDSKLPAKDMFGLTTNSSPYEKDDLLLPKITLDSINDSIELAVKPAFDYMWRAFGYTHSHNYQENKFIR